MRTGHASNAGKTTELADTASRFDAVALVQRRRLTEPALVYDITVDVEHEFFGNGICQKQSDAFLYAYRLAKHYWGKTPEKPKSAKDIWTPTNDEMYERLQAERGRMSERKESIFGDRIDTDDLFR